MPGHTIYTIQGDIYSPHTHSHTHHYCCQILLVHSPSPSSNRHTIMNKNSRLFYGGTEKTVAAYPSVRRKRKSVWSLSVKCFYIYVLSMRWILAVACRLSKCISCKMHLHDESYGLRIAVVTVINFISGFSFDTAHIQCAEPHWISK